MMHILGLIFFYLFFFIVHLHAVSGSWSLNANGVWSDASNWSGAGYPDGSFEIASFNNTFFVQTVPITVSVPAIIDIGTINKETTAFDFNIASGNRINIRGGITVTDGAGFSIHTELAFGDPIVIDVSTSQSVTVDELSGGSAATVTKIGAGSCTYSGGGIANSYTGLTTVSAGNLILNKTAGTTAIAGDATISATGIITCNNNNQFSSASDVTVNGGEFDLSSTDQTMSSLTYNSGTVSGFSGDLTLGGATALTMRSVSLPSTGSSGTVVLGGDVRFDNTNNGTATIASAINLGATTRTFNIDSGTGTPDMEVNGVISGSGGLTKTGAGILDLNGTNTYTGTTVIDAGTLRLANGTLGSDGALTINGGNFEIAAGSGTKTIGALNGGGSGIDINDNTLNVSSGTFSGAFTGAGTLSKITSGTLTLTGASTLVGGSAVVQAGSLLVNGTLTTTQVDVNSGGILGGTGTINAITNVSGILAPGSSIGTITVNGNYTQETGSTLLIEIDADGNSDRLRVTGGAVTINSGATLELDPSPGIYLPGTMYTVIDTDVAIVGSFDTILFDIPGLAISVMQNSDLILTLIEVGTFFNLSGLVTGNAQQVANCLDGKSILPGTDLETLASALQPLSGKALQDALDQMQPAIFGALNLVQESQLALLQSTFTHRLQAWGNGLCSDLVPHRWNIWIKPVGEFISQDTHEENIGYTTDAYGVMIGADRKFIKHLHVGIATGYVYNDVHWRENRGEVHSNNIYGGVYAFWQEESFHVLGSLIGGWNGYNGFRRIQFTTLDRKAKHKDDGFTIGGQLEAAYSLRFDKTRVQPFGSLQLIYATQDSYKEYGSGVLDLRVRRKSADRFRSELGLDVSHCFTRKWGQVVPNGYLGWVREVELESDKIIATFVDFDCQMTLTTYRPIRSLLEAGLGLTGIFFNERVSFGLRWDGEFGKRYSDQKALIEATIGF